LDASAAALAAGSGLSGAFVGLGAGFGPVANFPGVSTAMDSVISDL
jgi:hypothetical protein